MPLGAKRIIEMPRELRERRRQRAAEIVSQSFFAFPQYVSRLDAVLSSPAVDLAQVVRAVSADPEFCELVLTLAGTKMFSAHSCGVTIPQAVVLFGSERLRALALGCAFMKFAGDHLSGGTRRSFWQHSFLTARLSERAARRMGEWETGQAYLAGLLHDLGHLVLLEVAREEELAGKIPLAAGWQDAPAIERACFGVDHCEIGRSIASIWNLPVWLIDAIEHHHQPWFAAGDPSLAEIVEAGDRYANLLVPYPSKRGGSRSSDETDAVAAFLQTCVPPLTEAKGNELASFACADESADTQPAQLMN